MAHSAQISRLRRKRAAVKTSCTRIRTYADSITQLTPELVANLEERKERLSNYWSDYNSLQSELESLCDDEGPDRIAFEDMFFDLTAALRCMISDYNHASAANHAASSAPAASPIEREVNSYAGSVRLPKLDLPKFTGRYEEWFPFYEMFNSVINGNTSLTNYQKFQYLRASVAGEAAGVIQSLELSDQNYQVAWNLLKNRYENKRAIVQTHLRALFELPGVARENAIELRRVADGAAKHIQALRALRCPTEHWDDVLIYLISSKFDPSTAREWQTSLKGSELPTFRQFAEFLEHRCGVLESITRNNSSHSAGKRLMTHVAATTLSCGYCRGNHLIYYCRDFIKLSVPQRLAEVRKRRLCTNCLRGGGHSSGKCKSGSCRIYGVKHNSLLHFRSKSDDNSEKTKTESESLQTTTEETAIMTHSSVYQNVYSSCNVLLSTAVVYVMDADGARQSCRILLDSDSQANFITRSCMRRLKLRASPSNIKITGINGMTSSANEIVKIKLQSRLNRFSSVVECILTDRITERLPASPIDQNRMRIPQTIRLADPKFHRCSDIDVLIGVELFWRLICVGQLKSSCAHPTLQKTHFGWIVAGRVDNKVYRACGRGMRACHVSVADTELWEQLEKFWQLEENFRPNDSLSTVERFCEQYFRANTKRDSQGRVTVTLPIKEVIMRELGETRDIALRRFYSLERRLDRDPSLKAQYRKFMHEYLSLGHMRLVSDVDDGDGAVPTCYLPHHCVLKPANETTKLRVVFDASCKSSSGVSLNDTLMIGPMVQQDLFSIVLRFRTFRFVFSADVTKMYRQILVDPKQTRLQRIFWRDTANDDIKTFELKTVTYGTAAASYLATRTLKFLAETYAEEFPEGSQRIMRDFYVNDLLTGADTIGEALRIKSEIVEVLRRGAFQLSKWSANDKKLLNDDQNRRNDEVQIDGESAARILGVLWSPAADAFRFEIKLPTDSRRITKRTMLSEIAKLFDPLGLLGPVIVVPKMLLQEVWQLGMHWDEAVPLDLHTRWFVVKEQLSELNKLSIPRFIKGHNKHRIQIHGFCDASQRAYGACLYIRRQVAEGEFRAELLCSKTRVAPLKTISIPRLELCAAVLLANLWDKARSSIQMNDDRPFLWSDSTIVLGWISSNSGKWSVFVANRVGEIQRLTSVADWRHVSSSDNPADLLSRGIRPHDIGNAALWWCGPAFLRSGEDSWPRGDACVPESEMPEAQHIVAVVARASAKNPFVDLIHRFSNLNKLCRIIAYCRRLLGPGRRSRGEAGIRVSHGEISAALEVLCGVVQREVFPSEIEQLRKGGPLTSTSAVISLSPFLDERGLIRVGGRLRNSGLSCDVRHPILLPKSHQLTRLVIEREHVRNLHAGLQGTMAAVRQNFWPLSIRSTARGIIRKCIVCFKCRPIMSEAKMGVLPAPRVTPSRPFSNCGIDYAGPLIVREGKRRNARNNKAYACVFVCLAIKAVHLELVRDLTTDAFLAALKRFVSRRGSPVCIYSDNGTNFKGASRQLSELYEFNAAAENQKEIRQWCCDLKIAWQFIPPGAPHCGGLWESAVKSAKYHLQRIVGDSHLTFEELQTVLCEIEAVMNSRPLTPLSSDPNDLTFITPGHFLIGDVLNGFPCRDLADVNQGRLIRWQRVEQLRQHFWGRWSREYLNCLQQRHKWTTNKGEQLREGQMVLVKQPGLPPLQWILGCVTEVHPGADGIARSATVITVKGKIVRPLSRLAILPLSN